RHLFAVEHFFDHNFCAARSKLVLQQHFSCSLLIIGESDEHFSIPCQFTCVDTAMSEHARVRCYLHSFSFVCWNDNTFACCKPRGLHDDGEITRFNVRSTHLKVCKGLESASAT